jgi:PAS domain S-box-containing protein
MDLGEAESGLGSQAHSYAETELRKLSSAVEQSPAIVVITDTAGDIEYVNPRFTEITGYSAGEVRAKNPRFLKSGHTPAEEYQRLWAAITTGGTWRGELLNKKKNGELYWVAAAISPIKSAEGVTTHYLAIEEDVTERKLQEERLRLSDSILQHIGNLVLVSNPDGALTYVSPSAKAMLGFEPEELVGEGWWRLTFSDPAEAQAMRERLGREARGEQPVDLGSRERRVLGRGGASRWILWNHYKGPDALVVGVGSDITRFKELEEQFLQAQKMEAVGRLAGGVAHDFNNVLTAILGYGEMLLEDLPQSSAAAEDAREIRAAAQRATALTRQLLAFSRKQILQTELVDLNQVVAGLEKMLRRLLGEDVELAANLEVALPRVRVDPGQIEQVILNLAVNARDAMPEGGLLAVATSAVTLTDGDVARMPGLSAGPHVRLSVTDTGCGMTDAVRSHLFEPFFTTKEKGRGTGLGLATVYGIVTQSGGHIEVWSQPGGGASFTVFLPVAQERGAPIPPAPVSVGTPHGDGETVLVVEDEPAVRALATAALIRSGYVVLSAADPREAAALSDAHQGPIHLVVTDVVMPNGGARDVAELVARRTPEPRVLYMSGYTDDEVLRRGISQSRIPFLQKPFTTEALVQKVREVLARKT